MKKISKQDLKNGINQVVNRIIDGVETSGNLNFFQINIKHIDGDLNIELVNKYKEKIK